MSTPLSRLREKVAREIWDQFCPGIRQSEQDAAMYADVADAILRLIATDEDAALLVAAAREDAVDDAPSGFTMRWLLKGKGAEHDGDCTKKPYTCLRCAYDEHMRITAAALSALSPSEGTAT